MSQQTRILLATALALLFFIPYSYFFTPEPASKSLESKEQSQSTTQNKATQAPDITPAAAPSASASAPMQQTNSNDIIATVESTHYTLMIDKLGRITEATLKDERFLNKDKTNLQLFDPAETPKVLEVRYADPKINEQAFTTPFTADKKQIVVTKAAQTLTLTQNLNGITIQKIVTFMPDGQYNITIKAPDNLAYFIYPGNAPVTDNEGARAFRGSLVGLEDDTIEKFEEGDFDEKTKSYIGSDIAASADRYYTSVLYKKDGTFETIVSRGLNNNPDISIKAQGETKLLGYIGPKEYKTLKAIYPKLTSIIDYGIITFFAKPLFLFLNTIHGWLGNWGWSIVILTMLVRVVLYPLTYKGMVSMQKLKDLAPKVKEIQRKYKDDKQKMQVHMMDLYKKHGANPLGGCLPILLQMPIFFAIYMVLYNAIELKGAPWILWIQDLSAMDPYFILPILMGGSMYLHQVMTPTTFQDPMQAKIFKFLPIVFTFFFLTFPAGLVLYWFVNNVFSVIQQYIINKSFERKRAKKNEEAVSSKES